MAKTALFILLWIKVVNNNCELLVLWLIEQHLITSLQMHLDGTHLPREVLARPLYQPLAEVGGKLRPSISGDVHAAAYGCPHVSGNLLGGTALHRAGDEYPRLSVRVIDRQLYGYDVSTILQ